MARVLGCLTILGMALILAALVAHSYYDSLFPFILLCVGSTLFLLSGMTWAHTLAARKLKTAYLALVCFAAGAAAGALIGNVLGNESQDIGIAIWGMILGFWIGGLLCGYIGLRWGRSFHGRP